MMFTMNTDAVDTHVDIYYEAQLLRADEHRACLQSSRCWYITHPIGGPAKNTYTLVEFAPGVDMTHAAKITRLVAHELYGTAHAFAFSHETAEQGVLRYNVRLREHVVVTKVEVW